MWSIVQVWSTLKMKLCCHDWSSQVQFVRKVIQDNDMTDRTSAVYIENEIELSWLIGPGAVYDKNQVGQQHD